MAGSYPDPPGPRMALDMDGSTVVFIDDSNALTTLTTQQVKDIIDESDATFYQRNFTGGKVVVIFPELRDVTHMYLRLQPDGQANVGAAPTYEKSTDTTTGLDGTWTTWSGPAHDTVGPVSPRYRLATNAASATGVIAVRYNYAHTGGNNGTQNKCFHLYGSYASGQNPNRLAIWHPSTDTALTAVATDVGDVPRSSSGDITFRVKNLHPTLTANTITLAIEALTDGSPTIVSQYTLSSGGAFASTATISSLASGAISSVCTLRRALSASAVIGLYSFRLKATAASFS